MPEAIRLLKNFPGSLLKIHSLAIPPSDPDAIPSDWAQLCPQALAWWPRAERGWRKQVLTQVPAPKPSAWFKDGSWRRWHLGWALMSNGLSGSWFFCLFCCSWGAF